MTQSDIFDRRRRDIMALMGDGVAVMPTALVSRRNSDVDYPFRPDSDFQYLTGFPEPESVLVLAPGRTQGEYILFCRERDAEKETWHGRRAGLEGAIETFGADDAFPIEDIDDILPGLLENRPKIFSCMGRYPEFDSHLLQWFNEVKSKKRAGISAPGELVDISHLLHELRLIKSSHEISIMKQAARVSEDAHCRAMRACKPGMMEYQIQAELEYEFLKGGAHSSAYPSIVAGGANSCILHYTENSDKLIDGDLLLIDAGAEIDCYAADITRTFPVNGTYSAEQRAVYDIVLDAQAAAIAEVKSGHHWNQPHEAAVKRLAQGMIDLGLLEGSIDDVIENKRYQRFYMHRTGHWLGMDVHDVGDYRLGDQWRLLEPGMVLTVEPGLYIPATDDVDQRWHNIGIRIEDDVLVTRKNAQVLTGGVPKHPAEVEALMAEGVGS